MLRSRRGFTLIELLVVVAIIALLISILLPSLSKARETSRMVKCMAVQKQMGQAYIMYADSSDQVYVDLRRNKNGVNAIGGGFWGANIKFRQLLGLPVVNPSGTTPGTGQRGIPELMCPNKPAIYLERGEWYRTFAFNAMGSPGLLKRSVYEDGFVNRARVRTPASKVMGMDAANWILNSSGQMDATINWDVHGDDFPGGRTHGTYRHLEQTTMILHDGHGESFTKTEAYPRKNGGSTGPSETIIIIRMYDPYKLQ